MSQYLWKVFSLKSRRPRRFARHMICCRWADSNVELTTQVKLTEAMGMARTDIKISPFFKLF